MVTKGLLIILIITIFLMSACAKESDLRECADLLKQDYDGVGYMKEHILVDFEDNVSRQEAREIIQSYGLAIAQEADYTNTFVVKTPMSKEFEWICKLRQDERFLRIGLNRRTIGSSDEKYCEKDEDCIMACLDCCPCGFGKDAFSKDYIINLGINPDGNCSGRAIVAGCPNRNISYSLCKKNKCVMS